MQRLPQQISLLALSVFAVAVLAVAPVAAHTGPHDDSTTSEDSSGHSGREKRVAATTTSTDDSDSDGDDTVTTEVTELRSRAKKLVSERRESVKTKTIEKRQQACETRKEKITERGEKFAKSADKHLQVFNSIYDKVLDFQAKKQLTVANYDELKAATDAKKDAALAAVQALSETDVEIDCTADDPAAAVATLKESVANARKALHEYRLSIKDLVVALQTAKEDAAGTEETDENVTEETKPDETTTEAN